MSALARKPAVELVASGLEALSADSLGRVSRALHDDVGPSLCSAGLMLGLIRSSSTDLPPESREMLDSIQDALESCVDSVRLLSYHSDPGLADRCGWRGAIDYLTKGRNVEVFYPDAPPEFSAPQARLLVRLVHDITHPWTSPHQIAVTTSGMTIEGPPGSPLEASRQAALAHLADCAGFRFHCKESESGILISVQRGKKA